MKSSMKKIAALLCATLLTVSLAHAQNAPVVRTDIPLDSIRLSDPFIMADKATAMYYMTGTGGMLWKSKDLKRWTKREDIAAAVVFLASPAATGITGQVVAVTGGGL